MKKFKLILILISFILSPAVSQDITSGEINKFISGDLENLESLYLDLHQSPELSFHEIETARKMGELLEQLGFEVTRNFGGNSLVGIFNNGAGPVIMLRTDMDALPVVEKTNLAYASTITFQTEEGEKVGVMHACGHDVHMSVWAGTAKTLINFKDRWKGTLILIAQQAEETSGGANAMIDAGLFKKFPAPNYALALHVDPELQSGTIGYCPGPAFAGVSSVDIKIFGEGGHGAYPHRCIDPIVLASRTVLDLQTIVSRELSPLKPAVITVGSFHGGTKHNIIPDEVDLQLTLRYYEDGVYEHMINSLEQITSGIAASAGLPEEKYPVVVNAKENTPPVYNDPELTAKVVGFMQNTIGKSNTIEIDPLMAGEDFGKYGRTEEKIPIMMFMLGSVSEEKIKDHKEKGTPLAPLHSPNFAPDYLKTIETGILVMSTSTIELFNEK